MKRTQQVAIISAILDRDQKEIPGLLPDLRSSDESVGKIVGRNLVGVNDGTVDVILSFPGLDDLVLTMVIADEELPIPASIAGHFGEITDQAVV